MKYFSVKNAPKNFVMPPPGGVLLFARTALINFQAPLFDRRLKPSIFNWKLAQK
jgi:hypothetical protein